MAQHRGGSGNFAENRQRAAEADAKAAKTAAACPSEATARAAEVTDVINVTKGNKTMNRLKSWPLLGALCLVAASLNSYADDSAPKTTPPGQDKTTSTKMLESGAALLQSNSPLKDFDIYLVGFHPMKKAPEQQMEAHHYCHQVNEDFAQCVLFDGNTKDANMNGVEYIISEKVFNQLPEEERQYWHPHNGEILSGQLIAPGIPKMAEHRLMKSKMNSYGKTWHVWHTGGPGSKGDALPLGEPMLAWSFNRDGEAIPQLVSERDRKLNVNTDEIRQSREDLRSLAKPQSGVDALNGQFKRATTPIPGVVDSHAGGAGNPGSAATK